MRISLLNAQGLITKRTYKLNSDYLNNVFCNSDIVLFTETWTDEFSDLYVKHFEHFALHRTNLKRSSKRNSGGICIYVRDKFVSEDSLFFSCNDDILWLKLSADKLKIDKDLYIGLCYVLSDDSTRQSMVDDNIFDRLIDSLINVENNCEDNGYFVLAGDCNARTSSLPDFVLDDNLFYFNNDILPDEYTIDNKLPRSSKDHGHTNNNGMLLLDMCKQTGLRILNGRVGSDANIGQYTFVNSRGSSLIDYVLCKPELFECVHDFKVHDPNILSDHCLVNFSLDFNKK